MANLQIIDYPKATKILADDYLIMQSADGGSVKINANVFEYEKGLFKDEYVIEDTNEFVDVSEYARRYSKVNSEYAAVGAFYYIINSVYGYCALQPFCLLSEVQSAVSYKYYNFYSGQVDSGGRININGKYLYYSDNDGLLDNTASNISIVNANFPLQIINTPQTAFADYMTGVQALANAALNT